MPRLSQAELLTNLGHDRFRRFADLDPERAGRRLQRVELAGQQVRVHEVAGPGRQPSADQLFRAVQIDVPDAGWVVFGDRSPDRPDRTSGFVPDTIADDLDFVSVHRTRRRARWRRRSRPWPGSQSASRWWSTRCSP